jgi:hypothetical protein
MSRPILSDATTLRFWAKVERRSADACWTWRGNRQASGHGRFWTGTRTDGAHRVAYEIANGPIPAGLVVKHSCDNPACVNPSHLSVGTVSENLAEMVVRGRARKARGEESGKAKLTESDVRELRRLAAEGASYKSLATQFGIAPVNARAIVLRLHWRHVE